MMTVIILMLIVTTIKKIMLIQDSVKKYKETMVKTEECIDLVILRKLVFNRITVKIKLKLNLPWIM